MKNIWLALIVISVLFSCKSKTASTVTDTLAKKPDMDSVAIKLLEKFKPVLQGVWVKSDYIKDIAKTRSAYSSSNFLGNVADFIIEMSEKMQHDSLPIGYSLNNHEGGNFNLIFKQGQKPTHLKTDLPSYPQKDDFYELGYVIKADTNLFIYHYNKHKVIVDSVKYTRVVKRTNSSDAGYGIQYITNKTLFTGSYIATDTAGKTLNIRLDNEGKIFGLDGFTEYYINTDFNEGGDLDLMLLNLYNKGQQGRYAYDFKGDTLKLYNVKYNADSTAESQGTLKYNLVKKK